MTTGVEILILVLGIGFLVFELLTFDPDLEGRRTFEEKRACVSWKASKGIRHAG